MKNLLSGITGLLVLGVSSVAHADECPRIPNLEALSPYQQDAAVTEYYTSYELYCSGHTFGECACEGVTDLIIVKFDFCSPASVTCPYMGKDTSYCQRKHFPNGCPGSKKSGFKVTSRSASLSKLIAAATSFVNLVYTVQVRNAIATESMTKALDPIIAKLKNRPMTAAEQRKFDLKISQSLTIADTRFNAANRSFHNLLSLLGVEDGSYQRADFNRDGKMDYLLVDSATGNIDIWIRGTNRFVRSQTLYLNAKRVSVGDLNGDGKVDLTIERRSGGTISIPGNGAGLFLICAVPGICWQ